MRRNFAIIAFCLLLAFTAYVSSPEIRPILGEETGRTVYVGGFPIGLELRPKGVIVVGPAPVETELGSVLAQSPLCGGDIIESIEGKEIDNAEQISEILKATDAMSVMLAVRRGSALLQIRTNLIKEDMTGEKKLGLQIKESVSGVGTVTYVKSNGVFGCLGHPITLDNGNMVPCKQGFAYACKILGYSRGMRGKAGELKGAFTNSMPCGKLFKNCKSGIFGQFDRIPDTERVEVASRREVMPGKATILTTVGDKREEFSIEIVKTSVQNSISGKSMILRITDKRLLSTTGGIVQGMSGSPIIQNGKLVGAVTHVFVSDPTKGYGIYADWMLESESMRDRI